MKIIQAIYGKVSTSKITGVAVDSSLIIEGQKFSMSSTFPNPKLFVVIEKDNTRHEFLFSKSQKIEFDFSQDNCPTCKGSGTEEITMNELKDGKFVETSKTLITCYTCDGQPVSKLQGLQLQKSINKEKSMYCKCEFSHGSYYVPDTNRMKHHWKCKQCKKITQIG